MDSAEFCFQPLVALAALLSHKEVSPVELVIAQLERIERFDRRLSAYLTVLPERAMAEARRAESEITAGRYRGTLHGIPIGHKDIYETRGVRTTAHSLVLADFVPASDATVVRRLATAGAIMMGKLNTFEFACGATASFGAPRNPWDLTRTTGGSSAGSASAVAAGMCTAATGTDTGGSIRVPAAYCGVVGLKPTYGRVSRFGVIPLAWSLDHMGPVARTAQDCAVLLNTMAGYDRRDPTTRRRRLPDLATAVAEAGRAHGPRLHGVRIGVPESFLSLVVDAEIRGVVTIAIERLRELGATIVPVDLPSARWTDVAWQGIGYPETFLAHRRWLREMSHRYAPQTRRRILIGACLSGADYLGAQRLRRTIGREYDAALTTADVLAWPTTPRVAPALDEPSLPSGAPPGLHTRLTNLVGAPSVSVPCGFTSTGMPVGLLLSGRPYDEVAVLRVACAYEQTTEWYRKSPELNQAERDLPAPNTTEQLPSISADQVAPRRDEVVGALRREEIPVLEDDVDPLARALAVFRDALKSAESRENDDVEPPVYQMPGTH